MRILAGLLALAVAGCAEEPADPGQQERLDREAIDAVRQANGAAPPLTEMVPDPILLPDIETHDIGGDHCAFAPGTSLGARVISRTPDAFMKLDGEIVRFAADPGSRELPWGTRSLYNGREYSLLLRIEGEGEGEAVGKERSQFEGTVTLRDRWDRVVYRGTGIVQCGK